VTNLKARIWGNYSTQSLIVVVKYAMFFLSRIIIFQNLVLNK